MINLPKLAGSAARGEEAQRRERHHAALIAAIVWNIWQDRARLGPSVRQQPPTLKRGMTFGLGQRSFRDFRVHCRFRAGWQRILVPWGNCASSPSHEEGVALLVALTCNEVVPAHKEFLRARQTPVPLIRKVCWVLACTVPGTRYAAPGTTGSRLEYVQRVLVSYNKTAAAVGIL